MSSILQYNFPTTIRFGAGAVNELGSYLAKNQLSAPLIVTDAIVASLPFFKKIIQDLENQHIRATVFFDIHKNPVKSDVYKGTDVFDAEIND